jgi:hypothetical protein
MRRSETSLAGSKRDLPYPNQLCMSRERFNSLGHHIRIDAGRHFPWHAASPHFAGTSFERARQRRRAAWSWLDRDSRALVLGLLITAAADVLASAAENQRVAATIRAGRS